MRTQEQIEKIQKTHSNPVQLLNVVDAETINKLIDYYNDSVKTQKNTGPIVSYVKEGDGLIDDIVFVLRETFGNFKVRTAHFFDVTRPHMIHIDDSFDYPNSYKAFTVPLELKGDDNKAKLVFFDQYYYDGPAKFVNGGLDESAYYNEFVDNYERVHNKSDAEIHPEHLKLLTHLKPQWLEGLSVQRYFPWTVGSIIAFDSLQLHCASNFLETGASGKLGLSIFTTFD